MGRLKNDGEGIRGRRRKGGGRGIKDMGEGQDEVRCKRFKLIVMIDRMLCCVVM